MGIIYKKISILFVNLELKENQNSHEANLNVYVNLKFPAYLNSIGNEREVLNLQGFILNITPVNDGLISGSFRFLGICNSLD